MIFHAASSKSWNKLSDHPTHCIGSPAAGILFLLALLTLHDRRAMKQEELWPRRRRLDLPKGRCGSKTRITRGSVAPANNSPSENLYNTHTDILLGTWWYVYILGTWWYVYIIYIYLMRVFPKGNFRINFLPICSMYLVFTVLPMIPGIYTTRNAVLCQWMKLNMAILDMEILLNKTSLFLRLHPGTQLFTFFGARFVCVCEFIRFEFVQTC